MTEIVEQRSRERFARSFGRHALPKRKLVLNVAKAREQALHHERRADGVRKTRVIGARVSERSEPELSNAPQALDLFRFEEACDDRFLRRLERDEAMHWIA
jgi:hypothetical protein